MIAQDLVKYTKLSMLELVTLAGDAEYPIKLPTDEVDMQVIVRTVMVDVFIGCYPDRKLEILTYLRRVDEDKFLTNGIIDVIGALEFVQEGGESAVLPPLMISVTDSRYIGLMTKSGVTYDAYDMVNGIMCPKAECKWPWMSMVIHVSALMLRDRTFMSEYKNVALSDGQNHEPLLIKLDHPVQADTDLG